jgi:hypothetical protein
MIMSEDKKELSKEEKIEKGKKLMKELDNLELSDEKLKDIAGGFDGSNPGTEDNLFESVRRK